MNPSLLPPLAAGHVHPVPDVSARRSRQIARCHVAPAAAYTHSPRATSAMAHCSGTAPHNAHQMSTRAKIGYLMPKRLFLADAKSIAISPIPPTYKSALKDPH